MGFALNHSCDTYRIFNTVTKRINLSRDVNWQPFNRANDFDDTGLFGMEEVPRLWDGSSISSNETEAQQIEQLDIDDDESSATSSSSSESSKDDSSNSINEL